MAKLNGKRPSPKAPRPYELKKNEWIKLGSTEDIKDTFLVREKKESEKVIIEVEQKGGAVSLIGTELVPNYLTEAKAADIMYMHFSPTEGSEGTAHCYIYDLKRKIAKKDVIEHYFEQIKSSHRLAKSIAESVEYDAIFHFGVCTESFDANEIRNEISRLKPTGSAPGAYALSALVDLANIENEKRREYLEMMLNRKYTIGGVCIGIDVRIFKKPDERERILEMHFKKGILQ